jgi:hypothetical protein
MVYSLDSRLRGNDRKEAGMSEMGGYDNKNLACNDKEEVSLETTLAMTDC